MASFSLHRAGLALGAIAALLAGMTLRVAYLQTYGRQKMVLHAERQQHTTQVSPAHRGNITDRNGLLMATSVLTQTIYLDPQFMIQRYQEPPRDLARMQRDLGTLAELLDLDAEALREIVRARPEARFVRIAENRDERTAAAVLKLGFPGVGAQPVGVRHYPMGSLAAHVLGTVGREGRGLEGVELRFDSRLAGRDGLRRVQKDAQFRVINISAADYVPPRHGQHLVLSIDANIQMIAEQELAAACREFGAPRGEVVVLDPRNGEVLALANWPTFNPQDLESSTAEARLNRCIVVPYELGSTLKPFIMGPALAWGLTRAEEVWPIPPGTYVTPTGRRVSDVTSYPPLSTWDVLVKSSNKGMVMAAFRLGYGRMYDALTSFGFGQRTGIELPAEDPGLVKTQRQWTRGDTESVAQGYAMMATPLQLARAFCAFANGGRLVRPRLVRGTVEADGTVVPLAAASEADAATRVMNESSALLVRRILADVPVRGTARAARSKLWNVFGKTGTSHISRGRAGYDQEHFHSSFVGGAPLEEPKLVIAMVLHEVKRNPNRYYGGTVAAPAAVRVLERSLAYMQEPPSPPLPPPPANVIPVLYHFEPRLYGEARAAAR